MASNGNKKYKKKETNFLLKRFSQPCGIKICQFVYTITAHILNKSGTKFNAKLNTKMFRKPYKVKSHTQIKSTERKTLRQNFQKAFPKLTDEDIDGTFPKKESIFCMKVFTSNMNTVSVYLVQKRPVIFILEGRIFPTVYLLWKFPDLVPCFTTNSYVVMKIGEGADVMLPGLFHNPNVNYVFEKNAIACINVNTNTVPAAVGVTTMSSQEMKAAQGKGKLLIVYHFYGDRLCTADNMELMVFPQLGPPDWLKFTLGSKADFPVLGEQPSTSKSIQEEKEKEEAASALLEDSACALPPGGDVLPSADDKLEESSEEMDKLLIDCFFTYVKYSKTILLPMLTSTLYREITQVCPEGKALDIKKTSYKKVGQFLKYMNDQGVVIVKERRKGIEMLENINKEHPMFVNFYVEPEKRPKRPVVEETKSPPNIVEWYQITNSVEPVFIEFGLRRGQNLSKSDVKRYVTDYVKKHNLQDTYNPERVIVTANPLSPICKNEAVVTWEDLIDKVCNQMKVNFTITSGETETAAKGRVQPITMTVQVRSGNKKVTIIDNLELYGIRITEFAKECQRGVSASTTISQPPGKKYEQLLVQGNQVPFVYNLLTEKYKIPKKHITGLEHMPKKK